MVELKEKLNAIVDTAENFRTKVLLENEEEIIKKGKLDINMIHYIEDQVFEDDLRRQLILSKLALKDGVSISRLANELDLEEFDVYSHLLHLESEGKVESISTKDELVFRTRISEIVEDELLRLSLLPPTDVAVGQSVQNILATRLCTFCGLCVSVCPVNALSVSDDGPILDEDVCIHCSLCFENCPRTFLPIGLLKGLGNNIINRDHFKEEPIGRYKKCVMAQCTDDTIKTVKQDGGVVTSLVAYLLEKGEIDGAIVVGLEDDPWKPQPRIVRNVAELVKCAGTKYAMSPNLSILDTVRKSECEKICVVGTPCMLQALRKYQCYYGETFKDTFGEIVAIFGLFCMESFPYEGVKKIAEKGGVQLSDVKKTDINKGKFFLHRIEGDPIELPIAEVAEFAREACHYCVDLTSELADISVGSIGAGAGWSTAVVRTGIGEKIFENAVKEGYLKINEKPINVELVEKLSKRKKSRNAKAVIEKYQKSPGLPPHYYFSIKELAQKKSK
ncbi:Coenzyme F420 hydrogenase/dehydrogenase, beta subunit C-terminal domain [Candidatus Borrarchaeum sp.]|uniref:Coenzyme F420 hydrogenase/dehydrogenase, beta subunit C-terminal domain n=1 Tax=Candidatus Borrarchaeum sp. TaxID=2846742 RepID=UPI00257CF725|nr:Coenzyme F420 hydrogenase/dehydrogenase, beta subunit C-terminal domain [Candidatus Borrarchaeum sp.]